MSEKPKAPKKKAAKKAVEPAPAPEVLLACTVIQKCQIGAMRCLPGARAQLTEERAKTLEKLGKIRIEGIA